MQLLATESPLKIMKNGFYSMLKALYILKIFKFLSWCFGHVGRGQKLWCHNLFNKQLQYTYWPISQELKAIRQLSLVS